MTEENINNDLLALNKKLKFCLAKLQFLDSNSEDLSYIFIGKKGFPYSMWTSEVTDICFKVDNTSSQYTLLTFTVNEPLTIESKLFGRELIFEPETRYCVWYRGEDLNKENAVTEFADNPKLNISKYRSIHKVSTNCKLIKNADIEACLSKQIADIIKKAPKPLVMKYWPFDNLSLTEFLDTTNWNNITVRKIMIDDDALFLYTDKVVHLDHDDDLEIDDLSDHFKSYDLNMDECNFLFSNHSNIEIAIQVEKETCVFNGSSYTSGSQQSYKVLRPGFILFEDPTDQDETGSTKPESTSTTALNLEASVESKKREWGDTTSDSDSSSHSEDPHKTKTTTTMRKRKWRFVNKLPSTKKRHFVTI